MQAMVVYSSQTGNTQKIANAVFAAIPGSSKDMQRVEEYQGKDADIFFVGFWTDMGDCDRQTADLLAGLHGKKVALFGTCGMGKDSAYYEKIMACVRQHIPQDCLCAGTFLCQGKMPIQVRNRYEKLLQSGEKVAQMQMMIRNFDQALLHPDEDDGRAAAAFAREVMQNYAG